MPFVTGTKTFDNIEDFMEHMAAEYKKKPITYKIATNVRILRNRYRSAYSTAVWGWQRARRGYSQCDVWNLGPHLARTMPAMLRELKGQLHGWPGDPMTFEEWEQNIEKMALAFEEAHNASEEFREINHAVYDEGMELFSKYLMHLWD